MLGVVVAVMTIMRAAGAIARHDSTYEIGLPSRAD